MVRRLLQHLQLLLAHRVLFRVLSPKRNYQDVPDANELTLDGNLG